MFTNYRSCLVEKSGKLSVVISSLIKKVNLE